EQMAAAAPMGWLDQVTASGTTVRAVGWAFDRVVPDPVLVSVYVDGNPVKSQTASGSRPDLVPAFGVGERHGFDVTVTGVAAGRHRVCVVAHNAGRGGGSSRIGCRDLQV